MKRQSVLLMALTQAGFLAAAACGSGTPTQPPPVAVTAQATLTGHWRGLFEITQCAGNAADCDGPVLNEFQLTMVPSAEGLLGSLVLLDVDRTTVDVTARLVDGVYRFSAAGFDDSGTLRWPVRTAVSAIDLRADPSVGMSGSMVYTNTSFRSVSRTIAIRSAVQQPSPDGPGRFGGGWQGYYQTLSCTGDCQLSSGAYTNPEGGTLSLTLSQAGTDLVGVVMSHLVSGTAQATSVTASGDALTPEACPVCWDCEGVCQSAVRDFRASTDKLGRLTGTFEYSRKGWTGREHFRQTMRVSLVNVTRRW